MGQYVFINIPAISLLEFHPFSISSSPLDPYTSCHIKSMGKNTFTDNLLLYAKDLYSKEQEFKSTAKKNDGDNQSLSMQRIYANILVNVDGPYGMPFDYRKFTSILLVCGGIGITPLHGIFRTLLLMFGEGTSTGTATADLESVGDSAGGVNSSSGSSSKTMLLKVRLIWGIRATEMPLLFSDTFRRALASKPGSGSRGGEAVSFELEVFCSTSTTPHCVPAATIENPNPLPVCALTQGRFDLAKEVQALSEFGGEAPLVFVCGPGPMVQQASSLSLKYGVPFHEETFLL